MCVGSDGPSDVEAIDREQQQRSEPGGPSDSRCPSAVSGFGHLRREGSGDVVSADPSDCGRRRELRTCWWCSIDDAGFAASSAFGGTIETPTAERLAAGGLRYNRFHTTALCSPTRQALLTGRNHHSVGMGGITELATSAPGYTGVRPNTAAPLAETLKLNGYSTAQFGKCHEVPVYETSPMGPFDAWPTGGGGFEYFYGFIGGETNQWYPAIYEGTTPVEPWGSPEEGYHFTEDMTDHAIAWVRQQKALLPDKPFFMYFAPGATHAPHQAPKDWIDRYRGRFDAGWDALRAEIFERQKTLGVIPADAELTARPEEIPAWDDMADELKPVLARQMEVYAGFMAHTDHHVGRLIDTIEDLGVLDDTLVFYIVGDNGASAEGTINGTFNEMLMLNGAAAFETVEFMASKVDLFGGPEAYNHYAVGWAHAMDTPYQWTKQVASHWGGTRNGTIVHWPNGFAARGEIRSQFCHVIDIAPTVLEAAGLPAPTFVHGVQQMPLQGTSMAYSFDDATVPERHDLQYFEMFVNRGIYHQGWTACTRHTTPWVIAATPPIDDDVWELYGPDDWTQARNIADENPAKLAELQRLFLIEATKYNVLPLDDRRVERFNADLAGRPQLDQGKHTAPLRGHGATVGELGARHQEQVARRHREHHGARPRCRGCDHRPGRRVRRLESLRQGRQTQVLLQHARTDEFHRRRRPRVDPRRPPGPDGVRLRRRRPRQGRHRHPVRRRRQSRRRSRRSHRSDGLFG